IPKAPRKVAHTPFGLDFIILSPHDMSPRSGRKWQERPCDRRFRMARPAAAWFPSPGAERRMAGDAATPAQRYVTGGLNEQTRNDPRRHGRLDLRAVERILLSGQALQGEAASLR